MISSVHVDNKKKDIFMLDKGLTQELDHTRSTAEPEYSINFTEAGNKNYLSLHCNGSNSYLFVNGVKMYKLKAKDFELIYYEVCFGNISKDSSVERKLIQS